MSLVYPEGGGGGSDQLNITPGIVITVPSTSNDTMVTQNTLESSDGSIGITRTSSGTDIVVLSGGASGGGSPYILEPVVVATTEEISLTGLQTIDQHLLVAGDRVLVKNQSDLTENDVYVAQEGAWTKTNEATLGAMVYTSSVGFSQFSTGWIFNTSDDTSFSLNSAFANFTQIKVLGESGDGNEVNIIYQDDGDSGDLYIPNLTNGTDEFILSGVDQYFNSFKTFEVGWGLRYRGNGTSNNQFGLSTLVAGEVDVTASNVGTMSLVIVTPMEVGGTPGVTYRVTRDVGVGFTITSYDAAGAVETSDTSAVAWMLIANEQDV